MNPRREEITTSTGTCWGLADRAAGGRLFQEFSQADVP
jgi:hypothetical protein